MMLYIHVPFCASHCSYCAFYSTIGNYGVQEYIATLLQEIEHSYYIHGDTSTEITSIFFGGGTPSYIPAEDIARVMEAIGHSFSIANTAEITIEANPESVTKEKALLWRACGINRISMGVQSFNPQTLTLLERIHSLEDVFSAVDSIRATNFSSLSIDMIWGHYKHTTKLWLYELEQALSLGVEHLSCYALTVEENTALAQQHTILASLPTEDDICELYLAGVEFLENAGYTQYELSNFAQEGHICKHNYGYWNGVEYYGFGPSAASYHGGRRYQHPASLTQWRDAILMSVRSKSPLPTIEFLSIEDCYTEALLLGLRQKKGIRPSEMDSYLPKPFLEYHNTLLTQLHNNALIVLSEDTIKLTNKGFLLLDSILEQFII